MRPRKVPITVRRRRQGFTLIESVMALLIVSVMLVAVLETVSAARRGASRITEQQHGVLLAEGLLSEIQAQAFAERGSTNTGPETGETTRADFDDVDDYADWTESPPAAPDGTALTGYDGKWVRSVQIIPVDLETDPGRDALSDTLRKTLGGLGLSTLSEQPTDKDVKVIIVTVEHDGREITRILGARTAAWRGLTDG